MGFCLLNNVALAAAHARATGAGRVMIVDFDVHHGNGTQDAFYDDPSVLFVSLHQFPFYPGTGSRAETGSGEGRGHTINVPLSAGANDGAHAAAFTELVAPLAAEYAPDLLLVSAGFDGHRDDPIGGMRATAAGYRFMVDALVRAVPEAPLGMLLEGGYDLEAIEASLAASLEALAGAPERDAEPLAAPEPTHLAEVRLARQAAAAFWRLARVPPQPWQARDPHGRAPARPLRTPRIAWQPDHRIFRKAANRRGLDQWRFFRARTRGVRLYRRR
jgi:acetoin utilization deacetylase AcuC-like enzyme